MNTGKQTFVALAVAHLHLDQGLRTNLSSLVLEDEASVSLDVWLVDVDRGGAEVVGLGSHA